MKKILLTTITFFCTCPSAFAAYTGAPGEGVVNSVHDMRLLSLAAEAPNNRVCAFCHTPHHSYLPNDPSEYYPLWSRQLDTQTFIPYASSTINAIDWAPDIAIGPSRLCMSCHDGTIAPDQHYGNIGFLPPLDETVHGMDQGSTWLGGPGVGSGSAGLSNDHPIGFNYDRVAVGPSSRETDPVPGEILATRPGEDPWIRAADDNLVYIDNTWYVRVADRLYTDPIDGTRYMTCATCHDVHNKKNMDLPTHPNYLLLAPQADSALCLTCHIK